MFEKKHFSNFLFTHTGEPCNKVIDDHFSEEFSINKPYGLTFGCQINYAHRLILIRNATIEIAMFPFNRFYSLDSRHF